VLNGTRAALTGRKPPSRSGKAAAQDGNN